MVAELLKEEEVVVCVGAVLLACDQLHMGHIELGNTNPERLLQK